MRRCCSRFIGVKLLRPAPAVGDGSEDSVGYGVGTSRRLSLTGHGEEPGHRVIIPERDTEEYGTRSCELFTVAFSSASEKRLTWTYLPEVSRLRLKLLSVFSAFHFPSAYDLFLARTRVLVRQLNLSSPTTRTRIRLSQQARTPY